MFETMAVQNLRKLTDWLFKVKCWHRVILYLAQNGLWPVATNIFKEEQKVASYWPNTYECLVCPYLYLCIWGSCLYLCICLCFCVWLYCLYLCVWVSCLVWFVCSTLCMVVSFFVSGFLLFIFVSGCLVWSGCLSLSLCLVVFSLSLCLGVLSGPDAPLWAVTEWIEATVRLPAWHPLLVTDRDALVTDTTFHTFFQITQVP